MQQQGLNPTSRFSQIPSKQKESLLKKTYELFIPSNQQGIHLMQEQNRKTGISQNFPSEVSQEQQNKQSLGKAFKYLKHIHGLNKNLRVIVSQLMESQTDYIAGLQQREKMRIKYTDYLLKNNVLNENQCEILFGTIDENEGGNWLNIKQVTKQQLDILSELITNRKEGNLLVELMQKNAVELYQVYNDEYKKIGLILYIIDLIEKYLYKSILGAEIAQQESDYQLKKQQSNLNTATQKQVYDMHRNKKVLKKSEIVTEEEISSKYSTSVNANSEEYIENQYHILAQIISQIRKYIFKFLDKLSDYLQYITKYVNIFIELFEENSYIPKHIQRYQLPENNSFILKQIIKKSKECLNKFSHIMYTLLYPNFQTMNDLDTEIVKQLTLLYPEVFYDAQQLIKDTSKRNSHQYNQFQNQESESGTPFVLSFNSFDIQCWGKPCQVYLIKNYLIIIEDIYSHLSNTSGSKLKTKIAVNKLCIVEIDYTTQIEIYHNKMLYYSCMMYLSGGESSNGVFLEFKGKKMDKNELQLLSKHILKCQRKKEGLICDICSRILLSKWQNSIAISNAQIFKSIIGVKISYQMFTYNCKKMKIKIKKSSYLTKSAPKSRGQNSKSIEMKIIRPPLPQQSESKRITFIQEKAIPAWNKCYLQVLGIEYRYSNQQQNKYYVVRFSIFQYSNSMNNSPKLKRSKGLMSQQEINYNKVSSLVLLSQKQLYEIQDYIYNSYQSIFKSSNKSIFQWTFAGKQQQQAFLNIIKISQHRQIWINESFGNQKIAQIECMIIMEFFNSFFKTKKFRMKPEMVLQKLKISEGMWQILLEGRDEIDYNENSKNSGCGCYECLAESEDSFGIHKDVLNYQKFYKMNLSYAKKQHSAYHASSIARKNPYCHIFTQKLQFNYINTLHLIYCRLPNPNSSKDNLYQRLYQQVLFHCSKIQYLTYLVQNSENSVVTNGVKYNLLETVVKTKNMKEINILIFKLPNIQDYYKQIQYQQQNKKIQNSQKHTQVLSPEQRFFQEIFGKQNVSGTQQNCLFVKKTINNIYKDTLVKHLKSMIFLQLGISDQFIGHFMESFALTVVKKEKKKQSSIYKTFSKLFYTSAPKKYQTIQQVSVLHDFEKVFDVIRDIHGMPDLQNYEYYVSIKKIIKIQQPLLTLLRNTPSTGQVEKYQKLINSYHKILELQLAQIWYKLNVESIVIIQNSHKFLLNYLYLIFTYLHLNLSSQENLKTFLAQNFSQKALIKTGIISKALFQQFYQFRTQEEKQKLNGLTSIQQINKQNLKIMLQRRQELINLCKAQMESKENKYGLISKILKFVDSETSWNIYMQSILYIKNLQKDEYNSNFLIVITAQGIIVTEKIDQSKKAPKIANSMLKSTLKRKESFGEDFFLQFSYYNLQIEIFGPIITLYYKKGEISRQEVNQKLNQKLSFFTSKALKIYQLISFYKKWNQFTYIQDLNVTQSKLKINVQIESHNKLKSLQENCKKLMKTKRGQSQILITVESNARSHQLQQQFTYKTKSVIPFPSYEDKI